MNLPGPGNVESVMEYRIAAKCAAEWTDRRGSASVSP